VTKYFRTLALVFTCAIASTAVVRTQEKPAAPAAPKAPVVTPLKLQVVISRYQGEKKISSLPYTLSVNGFSTTSPGRANLRMGAKIPVMMMAAPSVDGKPLKDMVTAGPIQYQDVGTNIDCSVLLLEDGRYRLDVTVEDSSVYSDDQAKTTPTSGSPTFRSFRASDSMVLKDGGTAQFTAATDKVSGETVKVDVTLTVVK
jgi:hypothetical protein